MCWSIGDGVVIYWGRCGDLLGKGWWSIVEGMVVIYCRRRGDLLSNEKWFIAEEDWWFIMVEGVTCFEGVGNYFGRCGDLLWELGWSFMGGVVISCERCSDLSYEGAVSYRTKVWWSIVEGVVIYCTKVTLWWSIVEGMVIYCGRCYDHYRRWCGDLCWKVWWSIAWTVWWFVMRVGGIFYGRCGDLLRKMWSSIALGAF